MDAIVDADLVRRRPPQRRAGRPPGARRDPRRRRRRRSARCATSPPSQLGTVGAGNHYVDLFADEDGRRLDRRALRLARVRPQDRDELPRSSPARAREAAMDAPPTLLADRLRARPGVHRGDDARRRLRLRRPRRRRRPRARASSAPPSTYAVHNHHNFAWRETHDGEDWWVVRKGCTPAFPGQQGFVGSTMGEHERDPRGRRHAGAPARRSSRPSTARRRCRARRQPGRWARVRVLGRDCDFFMPARRHARAPPPDARLSSAAAEAGLIDYDARRGPTCASAGSSCAAAPPTRRRTPTSGSTRSSPTTATRSACCIASRRSGSPWPAGDTVDPYRD